jgi:hypothetical protein
VTKMVQSAAITYSLTLTSDEAELDRMASELSFCPNVPDITQRLYNTYRAPSGIALSAPLSEALGTMTLAWLESNPLKFSSSGRRRRNVEQETTYTVPMETLGPDATVATEAPTAQPAVPDADQKLVFTPGAMFELQRGELTRDANDVFLEPQFETIYTGTDRQYTDEITPGVYYAYRVRMGQGEFSPIQVTPRFAVRNQHVLNTFFSSNRLEEV